MPERLEQAVSDTAWLEAMLEAERALAHAESAAGVIPGEAAAAVEKSTRLDFDAGELV